MRQPHALAVAVFLISFLLGGCGGDSDGDLFDQSGGARADSQSNMGGLANSLAPTSDTMAPSGPDVDAPMTPDEDMQDPSNGIKFPASLQNIGRPGRIQRTSPCIYGLRF